MESYGNERGNNGDWKNVSLRKAEAYSETSKTSNIEVLNWVLSECTSERRKGMKPCAKNEFFRMDLVTFTEEILNGKRYLLCSEISLSIVIYLFIQRFCNALGSVTVLKDN